MNAALAVCRERLGLGDDELSAGLAAISSGLHDLLVEGDGFWSARG